MVDDGSTDGSLELCDTIASKETRVHVIHKANGGVSSARNMGIDYVTAHQKGGYIAFLDADDMWTRDFFDEKVHDVINRGYDLVGFQWIRCNHSATRYNAYPKLVKGEFVGNAKNVWNHRSLCGAMLYSLDLIGKHDIRFVEGLKINEDLIFHVQCMYLCKSFYLLDRDFYVYRSNLSSVSHQKRNSLIKYPPIIKEWVASDEKMNDLGLCEKGELVEGHIMATIYVLDMHDEHYQQFGRKRDIDKLMNDNPNFRLYLESTLARSIPTISDRWKYICDHPTGYRLRCYIKGAKNQLVANAYSLTARIKPLLGLVDKKRYQYELNQ